MENSSLPSVLTVKGSAIQILCYLSTNHLQQPTKAHKGNSTICAGLYWGAFFSRLLYSPNSKMWDPSIRLRPTPAHALLSRLMRKHHLNRWIPDGCIGAIGYFSQTTDSGILFPDSAAVSERPRIYHESNILNCTVEDGHNLWRVDISLQLILIFKQTV